MNGASFYSVIIKVTSWQYMIALLIDIFGAHTPVWPPMQCWIAQSIWTPSCVLYVSCSVQLLNSFRSFSVSGNHNKRHLFWLVLLILDYTYHYSTVRLNLFLFSANSKHPPEIWDVKFYSWTSGIMLSVDATSQNNFPFLSKQGTIINHKNNKTTGFVL